MQRGTCHTTCNAARGIQHAVQVLSSTRTNRGCCAYSPCLHAALAHPRRQRQNDTCPQRERVWERASGRRGAEGGEGSERERRMLACTHKHSSGHACTDGARARSKRRYREFMHNFPEAQWINEGQRLALRPVIRFPLAQHSLSAPIGPQCALGYLGAASVHACREVHHGREATR